MAVAAIFDVPGMTSQQYDQVMKELDGAGASRPDGRLHHVASSTPEGWLVIDIWETPEKLERFAQTLMPILQGAGVTPPQPRVYPVHNVVPG